MHGGVQLPLQLRQLLLHLAARADIRDLRLLDIQVVIDHDDVETLLGIHLSDGLQSALVPVDEGDVGVDHLGAVHVGLGQLVESEDPNDGDRVRAVRVLKVALEVADKCPAIRPRPWTR